MKMSSAIRRSLVHARRRLFEYLGNARYSRTGLNGLDRKLENYVDFDGGIFIEAGANDGVAQSNTYYLEKFRGWTGLLVEPVPELAAACRKNRRVHVAEAALVGIERSHSTVELHIAGLMSTVTGALGDISATAHHVAAGLLVQPELSGPRTVRVRARTLSALIDEAQIVMPIDLLSLDVEGGEVDALRGLDLKRHAPRFICVESRDQIKLGELLGERYALREVLTDLGTHRDLLYERC